jgi:hypothetical protein
LRAGRGQCRQGIAALNLGLEALANEIFRSGLAEHVFRELVSIPDKFGGLNWNHAPELQRTQKDDIATAADLSAGRTQRPIVINA